MTTELPVIQSCDGCGACCMEQSSPPGYVAILARPDEDFADSPFSEDAERLRRMPMKIKATLLRYMHELLKSSRRGETWCIWLDPMTRKCAHYAWRPDICRDAVEIGDAGCRAWRDEYEIESAVLQDISRRGEV